MMFRTTRIARRALAVIAVAAALGLTACTAGGATGSDPVDGTVTVKLGVFAINDAAVILLAKDAGIFEKHGIDLQISNTATDAISQSVVSGQVDMALDSAVHNMAAAGSGLPLQFVSGLTTWLPGESGTSTNALLTTADGPASGEELNGSTVAVVALGGAAQLSVQAFVDQDGGDSSTVKFTTLPLPAMAAALQADQIAAASINDPYYSQAIDAGGFSDGLGDPSAEAFGAAPRITVITSKDYAGKNPETITAFQAAMAEAGEYALANPDKIPAVLTGYFDTPADIAETAVLPQIRTDIDPEELQRLQELMLTYDYLDAEIAIDDLMAGGE